MPVGVSDPSSTEYVLLDDMTLKPVLVRRLPRALACRCHAVPVAEDQGNGRLTVAMADPDDATAREALETFFDTAPYVVRADPETIDALLAKVWAPKEHCPLRALVCTQDGPNDDEVRAYARSLCDLLGATISLFQMAGAIGTSLDAVTEEVRRGDCELVILHEPDQSPVERLFWGRVGGRAVDRVPTSLLVARRPRWPLRRILLVIRGHETDDRAFDWIARLARPSGATVTVLAVVPPVPVMYRGAIRMQQGLPALLATNTTLGRQMRRIVRRLVNWQIEGTLRLREGTPDYQIRRELLEGDYDLITITAETHGRWLRRLVGDVIGPLLRWADRPVLIAKPKDA